MNLKDRLAEKKSELLELEPMLKSEDVSAETIEKGEGLVKEIADLESQIEAAEKASAVLSTIGTTEENTNNDITEVKKMSVMEDFTKKCAEITDKKSGAKVHFETKANTDVVLAPQIADVDKSIAPVGSRTPAASFFTETQISGNAITYFIEGAFEGTPAATAQGAKKPQVSTSFTPKTLALSKIAAFVKETDEILTDAPFLASEVQNTLMHQVGKAEDNYVIGEIVGTSGIGAVTYDGTTKTFADAILEAILKVKGDSAYDASVVLLNPADVYTLLSAKDSNEQYYGGGYFVGAYGNGTVGIPSSIWGVQIFASSEVTQGQAGVVAREAVKTWRKGGMDVSIAEENEDDFIYNRVTLRAEVRLATAVVDLKGVVLVSAE